LYQSKKFGETALLLKPVGGRAQVDSLALHRPPQTFDKDVVVATTAPIHADLDPMEQQHPGEHYAFKTLAYTMINLRQ
jgi:hypothetical protein